MTSDAEARGILGVGLHADADEIRRAYRRRARHCHPDAGGDAAEFHRLQQAIDVLLGPRPRPPRPPASPSTSRMTRPSTSTRMGASGWGESSVPRWHEDEVDLTGIDWDTSLPGPPHAWSHELVAVAAARADDEVLRPVAGVSRRPASRLNRFAGWLSTDLLARWSIGAAHGRGIRGHDVELRIQLPAGGARKRGDQASWPPGWTRERRPSATIVTCVVTPSRHRRATALRAADQLVAGLDALQWPLDDWYRVA